MRRNRVVLWAALATAAALQVASAEPAPVPVTTLGPIVKEHNVKGADDLLYLKLRIPATIHHEAGSSVALGVWFADDSGSLIPALMRQYADASGHLKIESVTTDVATDAAEREFVLAVPYNAFPRRGDREKRYFVEARAKLVRRSKPQAHLAMTTTTFYVEE
jgi:hypothetical protein